MRRTSIFLGLFVVVVALSAQQHAALARVIGFPLNGVHTDVVEYDLAARSEQKLMEDLNFATSVDIWSATSDPETNTVYFHGFEMPLGQVLSVVKVDLTSKAVSKVPLVSLRNATTFQTFYHAPTKTAYEILVTRNAPAKPDVYLIKLDFDNQKGSTIKKFDAFSSLMDAFLIPDGSGTVVAYVGQKSAPTKVVAIDLATGDYKDIPEIQYNAEFFHQQWLSVGWSSEERSAYVFTLDTSYMVNNQRNVTTFRWNLDTGVVVRTGAPFLFPPKDAFFGTPGLVSATFDTKTNRFYASFSDRSSASGIVEVDAPTGKQMAFATYSSYHEPRQITTL